MRGKFIDMGIDIDIDDASEVFICEEIGRVGGEKRRSSLYF